MSESIPPVGYRARLFEELRARQKRNPSYSLRSFARDLALSPTTVSLLIKGKRNLTGTNLQRVATRLKFSSNEIQSALAELNSRPNPLKDEHYYSLSDDVFSYVSNWYYFAILSLASSGKAKANASWIAKRLNLSTDDAREALNRLQRLGLVEVRDGILHQKARAFRVPSDIPSAAARRMHRDHLHLAEKSLERDPIEKRDMTSMTVLARLDRIPKTKEMIKTFRRRMARYLEADGTGEEVYVLAVQLFPVSRGRKK